MAKYAVVSLCTALATYVVVFDKDNGKHEHDNGIEASSLPEGDESNQREQAVLMPIHELVYALFYEPLLSKSASEIRNAYWLDMDKHHDFFMVTISRFFYYMGISSQSFFLYFIHDVLIQDTNAIDADSVQDPEADVAYLAVVSQTFGALTCIPVGILSDQFFNSRRKPFVYISCLFLAIGFLNISNCDNLTEMTGICMILGAANGAYLTMDTSLAVDTLEVEDVPEHESKRTEENESHEEGFAQMLGIWGVFGFLGSSLGPLIGAMALLNAGDYIDDSTESAGAVRKFYSRHGYTVLFSLSAFFFVCSAISLTFVAKKGV